MRETILLVDEGEQKRIFDEWLSWHKGLFFKVVRAYAFNTHDRDDLFQEISIQVWNSIPNFRVNPASQPGFIAWRCMRP